MSPSIKSRLLATQSDERLLALVRDGHEAAFEALVHRYRKPLMRYCRSLCLCEARAEEALQQALMNAWVALRRGTEVRELRSWLYRVVHNAAVNGMRGDRLAGAAPLGEDHEQIAGLRGGAASLDEVLTLHDALAGMAALPPMQREVMVRTAVAGDSHEQVANALGITDGAVRGLLYRARASLREGVSAVTPGPLLAWVSSAGEAGSASGERIAELTAGGGVAGLGLAVKGGFVALTAGVAITGAVMAHSHRAQVARRHTPPSAGGELVASAPPEGHANAMRAAKQPNEAGLARRSGIGGESLPGHRALGADRAHPPRAVLTHRHHTGAPSPGREQSQPISSTLPADGQQPQHAGADDNGDGNRSADPSQDREQMRSTEEDVAPSTEEDATSRAPIAGDWTQSDPHEWGDSADEGGKRGSDGADSRQAGGPASDLGQAGGPASDSGQAGGPASDSGQAGDGESPEEGRSRESEGDPGASGL